MRKRKQTSAAGACSLQSRRGDGRNSVRSTASVTAAVPGSDNGNGLPWVVQALSQIIALICTIFHFLQTWKWAAQPATPQPCKGRDGAAAEPETAAAALVVAQVVTCDIAADTDTLLSSTDRASCNSSSNLQDVEALQQQLQEAQLAAAAARSRAEQLTDELRSSQQCTAEAQQKAVRLEDLYQQVGAASMHACKQRRLRT